MSERQLSSEQSDIDRLTEAFRALTGPERQLLTCALAGNHPPNLAACRVPVLRGLARAGARLTRDQRLCVRPDERGSSS